MKKFMEFIRNYLEKLNDLLEQDEDVDIYSVDELIEKFNDYGKDKHSKSP